MRFGWFAVVSLLLAGCSEAPATDSSPADPAETTREARSPPVVASDAAADVSDATPIAWDGYLAPVACAPAGPNACMGASAPSLTNEESSLFLEADPAFWNATLTLTWTASSPATETLGFRFGFYKKCGGTCWAGVGGGAGVAGTSPLVLSVVGLEGSPDAEGLAIYVHEVPMTPSPVYAFAHPGQEFSVEGILDPSPTPPA